MIHREEQRAARHARDLARGLCFEATDPRDTLGEHYLAIKRGLSGVFKDALALTLRFHPACLFRDDGELAPSLICAFRDARAVSGACGRLGELDEVESQFLRDPELLVAIQRIWLTSAVRRRARRSRGMMKAPVVFCNSILESFYAGTQQSPEGIETSLAMRNLDFRAASRSPA